MSLARKAALRPSTLGGSSRLLNERTVKLTFSSSDRPRASRSAAFDSSSEKITPLAINATASIIPPNSTASSRQPLTARPMAITYAKRSSDANRLLPHPQNVRRPVTAGKDG